MHGERPARQPSWNRTPQGPKEASSKHVAPDTVPDLPFEVFSEAVYEVQRNIKSPR